jgi:teichuronic acid biosynthesis glycosyltransferase TuaG
MPARNAERTIRESVRSVVAQTFADWELIIVDDCSAIPIGGFGDGRIRVCRNGACKGAAFSRNFGVSLAKGEWAAFLDADDLMRSDKLEKQLAFMRELCAKISYTASSFIGADGAQYGYVLRAARELTYRELLKRNLMSCSSVIVERDLIARHKFPDRPATHEDYASWLSIVREVGVAYGLDEPLLAYRLSPGSKSANRAVSAVMTFNAYRCAGYGAPAAAALTARYARHSIGKRIAIAASRAKA